MKEATVSRRSYAMLIDICLYFTLIGQGDKLTNDLIIPDESKANIFLLICTFPPTLSFILRASLGKHLLGLTTLKWNKNRIGIKESFIRSAPWIAMGASIGLTAFTDNKFIYYTRGSIILSFIVYQAYNIHWIMSSVTKYSATDYLTKSAIYQLPKIENKLKNNI